ncbi:nitrogen fixation protein NifZ [Gynuella sp.]|uniref:nitrogen fixation protein NifZ n=1 Tax=Gynuella sp. TaxID=2969146 RepID=UPI003D10D461
MRPEFEYGSEVRLIRNVRNDGTYPGREVGELLIRRGAVGCVYDVGTYLQDQLIYRVHFLKENRTVGCRGEELIPADVEWLPNNFEFRDQVQTTRPLSVNGEIIADLGEHGEIVKVVRESHTAFHYHVRFRARTFQLPESVLEEVEP